MYDEFKKAAFHSWKKAENPRKPEYLYFFLKMAKDDLSGGSRPTQMDRI